MEVEEHHRRYTEIIEKYGLKDEEKAEEIAGFLIQKKDVSADDLAERFGMERDDAAIFLSFIHRGLRFKQDHIDPAAR